jgi:hypothetical protein
MRQEDLKVVALCTIGATTFWFFNSLNKTYTTRISYPLTFNFNRENVVVGDLPEQVALDVTAGGWTLLRKTFWFNVDPVEIQLDNPTETKYITGNRIIAHLADQVTDLRINRVLTDTLFVDIEEKMVKRLAVRLDSARLSMQPSYRVVSPVRIVPDSVTFEGAASFIKALPDSLMLTLPKSGIDSDVYEEVRIKFEENPMLKIFPDRVMVSFEVAQFVQRVKSVLVDKINFPPDSIAYLAEPRVDVTFFVERELAEEADASKFKVVANYKRLNPQDSTIRPILLEHPAYVTDVTIDPPNLKVKYGK